MTIQHLNNQQILPLVGQRFRSARLSRNLTQQALAALEQGQPGGRTQARSSSQQRLPHLG